MFAHLWWFGVLGLGSYFEFLGLGLSVDGVLGLWCGAFWVFLGLGSLYKRKRITLGKKWYGVLNTSGAAAISEGP